MLYCILYFVLCNAYKFCFSYNYIEEVNKINTRYEFPKIKSLFRIDITNYINRVREKSLKLYFVHRVINFSVKKLNLNEFVSST